MPLPSVSDARTIRHGTRLGAYVVGPRIGRGGMAELYLARTHVGGDARLVALKLVLPQLKDEPQFLAMFQREARIAASFVHPNIVGVLDCGEVAGESYIAMEYVHGRDLRRAMQQAQVHGDRPLPVSLAIVRALCDALHHAHEQRGGDGTSLALVHRDVSPGNVLIGFDGSIKLADFGIAKAANHTQATRSGVVKGKLGYMSPEQCLAQAIDRRSDVFNLGILLYELTTGLRLFVADSDFTVMNQVISGEFPRPREIDPSYPVELERIVLTALAVVPAQRFATAAAMGAAIDAFARRHRLDTSTEPCRLWMGRLFGDEPVPALAAIAEGPAEVVGGEPTRRIAAPAVRRRRDRRWMASVMAAGLALVGGSVAWQYTAAADAVPTTAASTHVATPPPAGALPPAQPSPAIDDDEPAVIVDEASTRDAVLASAPRRKAKTPRRRRTTTAARDDGAWRRLLPPSMRTK